MMKTKDRQFDRFVLSAVVAAFLILIVVVSAGIWAFLRTQEIGRLVSHTFEVELAISDFAVLTERAEATRRGFLLQADERFAQSFESAAADIPTTVDRVARLTIDNPLQEKHIAALQATSKRQLEIIRQSLALRRAQGAEPARVSFAGDGGAEVLRELRVIEQSMSGEEEKLLVQRRARQQSSAILASAVLIVSGLLLLVVASGTIWAIRRNLGDVKRSRDGLRDMNENLEGAVAARTSDLQRANDEIQRFAYIVSHDLRSPLVNVMGFTAELDAAVKPLSDMLDRAKVEAPGIVTEDARLAVEEDLPEAIGFIRSSTQKMDRLINAILRLSREGRRVITPELLDMAEMLGGIVGSLQHRLTEIGAEVTVAEPLPDLVSDRVAVEQIFSNLVENAVKYLKPGRPGRITVRGKQVGDRLVYEIEDNGRGIDPKDHDRIFDLFRRSGAQDQPGEGIGLAHVRALAYRLGGMIECRSKLGDGATFSLSMPLRHQAAKETTR